MSNWFGGYLGTVEGQDTMINVVRKDKIHKPVGEKCEMRGVSPASFYEKSRRRRSSTVFFVQFSLEVRSEIMYVQNVGRHTEVL